ncbi:hypothetical protein LJR175_008254 [Variovorax sp. LjRoot175]|uniref:Mom family adenine methylcarbamoylation protein n=1 Tax=Variovorax sp. LjRoot175 TaxID=3342276 RepID=UPI003ED004A3
MTNGSLVHRTPHPQQLDLQCQRWSHRRASYRPAGEIFDPKRAGVEPIEERDAKAFVETHHYSGSYPAARFRAGVFVKEPFQKARLAGVGVFSVPMNQKVIPAYFQDLDAAQGVELGRFVLAEDLASNAESWSLARMKKLLREALPEVRGVVAYSDPIERRNETGALVKRGHVGTIYKATNAAYRGLSSARTLWLAPNGASLADRLLSKVRNSETGERYALERLAALGAPRRQPHEGGAAYIRRLKEDLWLKPVRHPGNHAFTWNL